MSWAQKRSRNQRLQLAHDLGVAGGFEVTLQSLLERTQVKLLQPSHLGLGERCVSQVLERGPPEQREGLAEDLPRSLVVPGCEGRLGPIEEGLESLQVELAIFNPQQVPGRPSDQARSESVGAEGLPQPGHVRVEGRSCADRRDVTPDPLDEAAAGYHHVAVEEQHGQRRPLLLPADREDPIPLQDLERTENPELHHASLTETGPQPSTGTHLREGRLPGRSVRC
jgi:hypothetical protein